MTDDTDDTTETNHTYSASDAESESILRELYEDKKLSMNKVADRLGCSRSKVRYWMDKHGVNRRSRSQAVSISQGNPTMETGHHGYEKFQHCFQKEHSVLLVHRLTAVAEYGFDAVCDSEVHHKNGIPWDNRPENLQPLSVTEHKRLHADSHPFTTKLLIMELAHNENMKRREIAEAIGVPTSTVCSIAAGQGMGGVNA